MKNILFAILILFSSIVSSQDSTSVFKDVGYYYDVNGVLFHQYLDLNYNPYEMLDFNLNNRKNLLARNENSTLATINEKRIKYESASTINNDTYKFYIINHKVNLKEKLSNSKKKFYGQLQMHFTEFDIVNTIIKDNKLNLKEIVYISKMLEYELDFKNNTARYYDMNWIQIEENEPYAYIKKIDSVANGNFYISDYYSDEKIMRRYVLNFSDLNQKQGWYHYYRPSGMKNYSLFYDKNHINKVQTYYYNNEPFEIYFKSNNKWKHTTVKGLNGVELLDANRNGKALYFDSLESRVVYKDYKSELLERVYYLEGLDTIYLNTTDPVKFKFLNKLLVGFYKMRKNNIVLSDNEKTGYSLLKCRVDENGLPSNFEWEISLNEHVDSSILKFFIENENDKIFIPATYKKQEVTQDVIIPISYGYLYLGQKLNPTPHNFFNSLNFIPGFYYFPISSFGK